MFKLSWLKALLINPGKLKDKKYLLFLFAVFFLFVLFSIYVGKRMGITGDFAVFWYAGKNFFDGNDLYSGIGGACRYIYPPFAAMLFQVFIFFPMNVSAGVFTFINLLLFLFSIFLTRSIFEYYITDKKTIRIGLIFSTVFSFRFFLYHFHFGQMNLAIFVLCLLGVLLLLKKKETFSVICFVIATFIKIIPLFFLIWLVFRGNFNTYKKIALISVLCLLLPMIWRGPATGIRDIQNYYSTFLEPFRQGKVEPELQNQSLSAGIYKIALTTGKDPGYDYNILHLTEQTAKQLYSYSFLCIFFLLLSCLFWLKFTKKPITFLEISIIFLATHLLSGITWEYHLVSMLFVNMTFFILAKEKRNIFSKGIIYFLISAILLLSLVGTDTVGTKLYHYIEGYSALPWMLVLLFLFCCYEFIFRNNYSISPPA